MSKLLSCAINNSHWNPCKSLQTQFKCLHTSQIKFSAKDYYEIKLIPFADRPKKGIEGWRRKNHLPHHVDNAKWREEMGLPQYLNSSGPLTDNPDYSYVDETVVRPPPYGWNQRNRILEQIEHAKTIVQFCKEMDHGKQKYQEKLKAKELEKQNLLDSKLKPKGKEIL